MTYLLCVEWDTKSSFAEAVAVCGGNTIYRSVGGNVNKAQNALTSPLVMCRYIKAD